MDESREEIVVPVPTKEAKKLGKRKGSNQVSVGQDEVMLDQVPVKESTVLPSVPETLEAEKDSVGTEKATAVLWMFIVSFIQFLFAEIIKIDEKLMLSKKIAIYDKKFCITSKFLKPTVERVTSLNNQYKVTDTVLSYCLSVDQKCGFSKKALDSAEPVASFIVNNSKKISSFVATVTPSVPDSSEQPSATSVIINAATSATDVLKEKALKINEQYRICEQVKSFDEKLNISGRFITPAVEKAKALDDQYKMSATCISYATELDNRYSVTTTSKKLFEVCAQFVLKNNITKYVISKYASLFGSKQH